MMRWWLYLLAVALLTAWILVFFVWDGDKLSHVLLVMAVICVLLQLIRGRDV